MIRTAQTVATSALLALAALAALDVPAPRLIATGCSGAPATLGVKLARHEDELPRCETVTRLPWVKE